MSYITIGFCVMFICPILRAFVMANKCMIDYKDIPDYIINVMAQIIRSEELFISYLTCVIIWPLFLVIFISSIIKDFLL